MNFIRCVFVVIACMFVQASADVHYRLVVDNQTKRDIHIDIQTTMPGLDHKFTRTDVVQSTSQMSQIMRNADHVSEVISAISNGVEQCQFKGDFPIALPSADIYASPPVLRLLIQSHKMKKFTCLVTVQYA